MANAPLASWRAAALLVVGLACAALVPSGASAHEQRDVGGGRYSLTVGFINEPAFVGLENGLWLRVVSLTGEQGPVEGLAGSLSAEVIFGESTMALELHPVTGDPGVYEARFVPTQAGDYTFHLTGQIGDQAIDETFRSSPDTFDSVQPAAAAQFPEPVPAGAELVEELQQAKDDASSARSLAMVALAIGAVGLVAGLGGIAFAMQRRRAS